MEGGSRIHGTTWDVYLCLLTSKKPIGARDVWRKLHLSSPSLAQYHVNKLLNLKLIEPTVDHPHTGRAQVWKLPEVFVASLADLKEQDSPVRHSFTESRTPSAGWLERSVRSGPGTWKCRAIRTNTSLPSVSPQLQRCRILHSGTPRTSPLAKGERGGRAIH